MGAFKAKFPKTIAVVEIVDEGHKLLFDENTGKPTDYTKLKTFPSDMENDDAVAVYELKHVYTYRTDSYLDED